MCKCGLAHQASKVEELTRISGNGEGIDRDTRTPNHGRIQITGFTAFTAFDLRQYSESQPFPPGARNGRRTVLTGFMIGPMKAGKGGEGGGSPSSGQPDTLALGGIRRSLVRAQVEEPEISSA